MKYEATVGAGLPIIDTYHKLVETGDRVLRIEGCVSGTLMYVVSAVSAGRPFSQAVREAVELGYAEPDPRDDLSGRDAARKALILARLMGYRGAAPDAGRPRAAGAQEAAARRVHGAAARGRRRVDGARRARGGAGPRAALRGHRDPARRLGAADVGRRRRARSARSRARATWSRSPRGATSRSRSSSAAPAPARR